MAIYYKMTDELEELEEDNEATFDALNKKIEEQVKEMEDKENGGYSAVPEEEKKEDPESPNNVLVDGVREFGEDVELE